MSMGAESALNKYIRTLVVWHSCVAGLFALICLISSTILFEVSKRYPAFLLVSNTPRSSVDEPVIGIPVLSESVPIDYLSINVKREPGCAECPRQLRRIGSLFRGRHYLYPTWAKNCCRHLKAFWWFCKGDSEEMYIDASMYPMSYVVGRSLSAIFDVNLRFWKIWSPKSYQSRIDTYICSQLPFGSIAHGFECEVKHHALSDQGSELQAANYDQPPCELGKFSLYLYVLIGLIFGGVTTYGFVMVGRRCFVRGGFLSLLGFMGVLGVGTAATDCDPFYFWRPIWIHLLGTHWLYVTAGGAR